MMDVIAREHRMIAGTRRRGRAFETSFRMRFSVTLALLGLGCATVDDVPTGGVDAAKDGKIADAKLDSKADAALDASLDAADATTDADDGAIGPVTCNAAVTGSCPSGQWCSAANCGFGICVPAPLETNDFVPVCGCDRVTYWNTTTAQNLGATPDSKGECGIGLLCGGLLAKKCPLNTYCNYSVPTAKQCNIADPSGVCWGLPNICPPVSSATARPCGASKCGDACSLIQAEQHFYDDPSCP